MNAMIAFGLIVMAGVINGSFALPTKYVERWKFENIWLNYAVWAFVLLPWIFIFILTPNVLEIYRSTSTSIILVILFGGLIFGAGQVCFALSMNLIGLGLGFVINLGLGISLGFLFPLIFQHPQEILTPFGITTLIGTLLAVLGLIFSSYAGQLHRVRKSASPNEVDSKINQHYKLGVMLAIFAGLSSAGQNFSFSLTAPLQQLALHLGASSLGASIIMWPGFLVCAFIPYAIYMLFLNAKNHTFSFYYMDGTGKYYFFAMVMGLFWFGSLIFYSKASLLIGALGPLVGWPLFMALIILVSNFWGWRHKEWEGCTDRVKHIIWLGLVCLILSVVVLGVSSLFHA